MGAGALRGWGVVRGGFQVGRGGWLEGRELVRYAEERGLVPEP